MPKSTASIVVDRVRVNRRLKAKFNVGGRKSAKSAHGLPTVELLGLLTSPNVTKARMKIIKVARLRGFEPRADLLMKQGSR